MKVSSGRLIVLIFMIGLVAVTAKAGRDDFSIDTTATYQLASGSGSPGEVELTWNNEGYVTGNCTEWGGRAIQGDSFLDGALEVKLRVLETFDQWASAGISIRGTITQLDLWPGVGIAPSRPAFWSGWDGGSVQIIQQNNLPIPLELNKWYIIKVDIAGDTLKAKYWEDGAGEPADWQIDSNIPAQFPTDPGGVGLLIQQCTVDFDYIEAPIISAAVDAEGKLATKWGELKKY